jgi:hypothetical protein
MLYQVKTTAHTYTVSDDIPKEHARLLVQGQLLTLDPLLSFELHCATEGIVVKTVAGGFYALVGRPDRIFTLLATQAYEVEITVTAATYLPETVNISIPQTTTFPIAHPPITLRHIPVYLQIQTTQTLNGDNTTPVVNATISTVEDDLRLLRTPLHAPHAQNAVVTGCTLATVGAARTLAAAAPTGVTQLQLTDVTGLANGHTLRLGSDNVFELVELTVVNAGNGQVDLAQATTRSHSSGTTARRVNITTSANATTLAQAVERDDGVVQLAAPLIEPVLRVAGTNASETEHAYVGAVGDVNGHARFAGVSQIKSLTLMATQGTLNGTCAVQINYQQAINHAHIPMASP